MSPVGTVRAHRHGTAPALARGLALGVILLLR